MRKLSTTVFHVEHVSVMSNQTGDVDGLASALRTLAEDFRGTRVPSDSPRPSSARPVALEVFVRQEERQNR